MARTLFAYKQTDRQTHRKTAIKNNLFTISKKCRPNYLLPNIGLPHITTKPLIVDLGLDRTGIMSVKNVIRFQNKYLATAL